MDKTIEPKNHKDSYLGDKTRVSDEKSKQGKKVNPSDILKKTDRVLKRLDQTSQSIQKLCIETSTKKSFKIDFYLLFVSKKIVIIF